MALVLKGLTWKSVITFLDDVIVLGKDFNEHLSNVQIVLEKFHTAGMKLKPSKCHLFRSVVFLGKLVCNRPIEVNPEYG